MSDIFAEWGAVRGGARLPADLAIETPLPGNE
jgi:hypothetical protein